MELAAQQMIKFNEQPSKLVDNREIIMQFQARITIN